MVLRQSPSVHSAGDVSGHGSPEGRPPPAVGSARQGLGGQVPVPTRQGPGENAAYGQSSVLALSSTSSSCSERTFLVFHGNRFPILSAEEVSAPPQPSDSAPGPLQNLEVFVSSCQDCALNYLPASRLPGSKSASAGPGGGCGRPHRCRTRRPEAGSRHLDRVSGGQEGPRFRFLSSAQQRPGGHGNSEGPARPGRELRR